ncbi:hypothetical protein PQU92_05970 [Asticcacaulis sp. BYS171W]|uniref:DUF2909 domain-containing protein n=1 Tax=Asticcacaulis aquaticus TaxID=2984212 RepID=A0ABT5HRW8_9CAUL|nr:hypothetical protein [Asticcacaulis aquaticus]MDC7682813.1 hypothetical protein [Asticcacaulis aquaticus]
MTLPLTLICLGGFALLALVSGWLGARPPDFRSEKPRLMPWRFIMLLSVTVTIILIVHTLTLLGLKSDPPVQY